MPRAILIGAAIDIGGTLLCSLLIGVGYSLLLNLQGHSSAEIEHALTQYDRWSLFGLLLTAVGLLMSMLGGYQCAVIANRPNYLAPGILSLISVTFGATANGGLLELKELLLMSGLTVAAILGSASIHVRKLSPEERQ